MTTKILPVPYAPPTLVNGDVGAGNNIAYEVDIPMDATPSGVGSISVEGLAGASFNAITNLASAPDVFGDAPYTRIDGTFNFQVAPPTPDKPGTQVKYQVNPGDKIYVNITCEHDGKPGKAQTARCQVRAAQ